MLPLHVHFSTKDFTSSIPFLSVVSSLIRFRTRCALAAHVTRMDGASIRDRFGRVLIVTRDGSMLRRDTYLARSYQLLTAAPSHFKHLTCVDGSDSGKLALVISAYK